MNPLPFAAFILSSIVMGFAERSFINAAREQNEDMTRDEDLADRIYSHPSALLPVVAKETAARLRALLRRQNAATVERRRLIAWAAILTVVASFIWIIAAGVSE